MRPRAGVWFVLAAALAATGCGANASLPPVTTGPVHLRLFGFNDNSVAQGIASPDADAALARRAGANALRVTLDWRSVEKVPGYYDFRLYDGIYSALAARGVRPVWIALFAPAWAHPGACPPALQACAAPPDPAHDVAWAAFIRAVVRRYPSSAGVEVWNEPNYVTFWYPRPDPARYVDLLATAYRAVHAEAPSIPVVSGGFGDKPVDPATGDVDLVAFTRAVFARGGGRYMDALGFHPYPLGADESYALQMITAVRAIRDAYGLHSLPLWATETGVSTSGSAPLAVTPSGQARELVDLYERIGAMEDVQALFFHTLLEPPFGAGDPETGYGIAHEDGTPKPAFTALRAAVARRPPSG